MVCKAPIQLPIPAPVAAMTDDLARGGLDRGRPSQHGEGGLGAESARMGPADQQLSGGDGADPGLGHQHRGHGRDELAQLGLQLLGVSSGGQDPLGGQAKGPHGGPVLHRIGGRGDQPDAGAERLAPGPPPQDAAQRFGGGDDQGLELAAGVRPGLDDAGAGAVQDPQGLPVPALAGAGEVLAGEGFAAGPDRVQPITLGPVAAPGPLGPVDLDHPLALVDQKPGQPGSITAGSFQGPDPPA
jgi:hypothetical protein